MGKNAFLLSHEYQEHFNLLTDEELGQLIRAIMAYEADQEEPQNLSRHIMMVFVMIRQDLDRNRATYEKTCESRKQNAQKRWTGKDAQKNANACKSMQVHAKACKPMQSYANDADYEYDYEYDNDNEKEKDNKYIAQPPAVERPKKEPKKNNAADFDYFWTLYPKRVAKQAARKAFDQALKKASPGDIFVGAKAFADWCIRNGKEPQYIPYPATWLRAERWRDELVDDTHVTPWEKERKAGEQRTNDAFANVAAMLGGGADGAH